jgi:uncharacterized protein (DUF1697 family)
MVHTDAEHESVETNSADAAPLGNVMTTQIILLRGVNVGGNKPVAMAELKQWFARLGLTDARTLLQSGNVVVRSAGPGGSALEKRLETAAEQELGLKADFLVRSRAEWDALVAGNPFPAEAKADPSHLVALTLKAAPSAAQVAALAAAIPGREKSAVKGRNAYLYYPDGIGDSKLTPALLDRTLGCRGTARNWNTVLKIAVLAHSVDT